MSNHPKAPPSSLSKSSTKSFWKSFTRPISASPRHKKAPTDDQIKKRAHKIWEARVTTGKSGSPADDWQKAVIELQSSYWRRLWRWTGIPEKRGWDLLQLLTSISIPVILFVGGSLFTYWNNQQQIRIANEKRKDEVLNSYFDNMRVMLMDKDNPLRKSKVGDENRSIAHTLTLTTLRQLGSSNDSDDFHYLDAETIQPINQRKGLIINFLLDANLIQTASHSVEPFVDLRSADLRGIFLGTSGLYEVDLSYVFLSDAFLSRSVLSDVLLRDADLRRADLSFAVLGHVVLQNANLRKADLSFAVLSVADLSGANLSQAILIHTILLSTNLREVKNLTQQQLQGRAAPLLCNVALSKEFAVNPNRDCDRIAQELVEQYPEIYPTLQYAQNYVNRERQWKWD